MGGAVDQSGLSAWTIPFTTLAPVTRHRVNVLLCCDDNQDACSGRNTAAIIHIDVMNMFRKVDTEEKMSERWFSV